MEEENIIDMIRNDQHSGTNKNWKMFRDKLRLKRAGKVWKSSVPIPASDISMPKSNRMMVRRGSSRYSSEDDMDELDGEATRQLGHIERQRSSRLLPVETDPEEDENEEKNDSENEEKQEDDQQMSLMSLLSTDGSNYLENAEQLEEEQQEEHEEDMGDCYVCSKCKGKHKGEALGPCGHTFCKNCTKELHVSRGNCPTCNDYILEILDIY